MLIELNVDQARFIALLAKAARTQRDSLIGKVAEADLGDPRGARGEHNPTAPLGLDPLPEASSQTAALKDALGALTAPARAELNTLRRIGQGDIAANKWHRGLAEAVLLGDSAVDGSYPRRCRPARSYHEGSLSSAVSRLNSTVPDRGRMATRC